MADPAGWFLLFDWLVGNRVEPMVVIYYILRSNDGNHQLTTVFQFVVNATYQSVG